MASGPAIHNYSNGAYPHPVLETIRDSLLALAFPRACTVCGAEVESYDLGPACANCWSATRPMSDREPHCPKCGRELTASTAQTAAVCHACDDHKYDIARSAGYYEHALRAVVLEMKERPVLSSRVASVLLGRFTSIEFINYPCLIPVPLSRKRLLERGFNQADIIARHLGRRTGLRVIRNSLIRTGHTAMHRGGMDRKAREMSVKDSFEVVGAKRIEGMRVVVIDDVFTSGATASECAASLKNAGASSVGVFTLARTRYL